MHRDELNGYWQKVIAIDKVVDFNKHHCSPSLKVFLEVENAMRGGEKVCHNANSVFPHMCNSLYRH